MQESSPEKNELIQGILSKFMEPSKSKKLLRKAQEVYLLKSFKIKNINTKQILEGYFKIQQKYEKNILSVLTDQWHKNQRKIFIWFLICYCEHKSTEIPQIRQNQWQIMSQAFFGKLPKFLEFQGLSLLKNAKRYLWNREDDQRLRVLTEKIGLNQWNQISKRIFFDDENPRFVSPKQCRQRWFNHLNDNVNKGKWSPKEDKQILELCLKQGKCWAWIAKELETNRTEHMIKNRYNSIMNSISSKKRIDQEKQLIEKALKEIERGEKFVKHEDEQKDQMQQEEIEQEIFQKKIKTYQSIETVKEEKFVGSGQNENNEQEFEKNMPQIKISYHEENAGQNIANMGEMLALMTQNNQSAGCLTFPQGTILNSSGEIDPSIFALTPKYKELSPMDPAFLARSTHSFLCRNGDITPMSNMITTPTPTNTFSKSFKQNTRYFFDFNKFTQSIQQRNPKQDQTPNKS